MEKEKNNINNGVNIIIAVFILEVVGLIIALFLVLNGNLTLRFDNITTMATKENTNNSTNENINTSTSKLETEKYNYDNIEGLYSHSTESKKDENGNEYSFNFNLYLYKNGTFNYRMSAIAPYGYIGNYIIKDDTVILNYLFRTGSGADLFITNGNKTLRLNSVYSITDSNPMEDSKFNNKPTSIDLKKQSKEKAEEFLKNNDFSNYINNYSISKNPSER